MACSERSSVCERMYASDFSSSSSMAAYSSSVAVCDLRNSSYPSVKLSGSVAATRSLVSFAACGASADEDGLDASCLELYLSWHMLPTCSFFIRSSFSTSSSASGVPLASSSCFFFSSSASRCWRFSRCRRIIRLLSMFGWKCSSSSESSRLSHLE